MATQKKRKAIKPGHRFGRLTVVSLARIDRDRERHYLCRCVCGVKKTFRLHHLERGLSTSCGCYRKEMLAKRSTTHGQAARGNRSPEYTVWHGMVQRCTDPNHKAYSHYGGRGIRVCKRWRESFEAFYADMGSRPKGLTLERKNNEGNYSPGNCKWATWKEQAGNTRRQSRKTTLETVSA